MQSEKKCYFCGRTDILHKHHIFAGSMRNTSEKNGFWVWLCPMHHTGDYSVHSLPELDEIVKARCQYRYEQNHTREEFIHLIGQSVLGRW